VPTALLTDGPVGLEAAMAGVSDTLVATIAADPSRHAAKAARTKRIFMKVLTWLMNDVR